MVVGTVARSVVFGREVDVGVVLADAEGVVVDAGAVVERVVDAPALLDSAARADGN